MSWNVLDISKFATTDEIKKQYRKLALKFHPDCNNSPEAEEHFKEISEVCTVLSDAKKRQIYDQYDHADFGEQMQVRVKIMRCC